MGGCANSKYAVDEESKQKQPANKEGGSEKKVKKPLFKKLHKNGTANGGSKKDENTTEHAAGDTTTAAAATAQTNGDVHHKEEIEFIDNTENNAKVGATTVTTTTTKDEENEDAKKEVTTYQTTVVKHTQKEGDELLQHLKDEAFRTLQNSLKHLNSNTTKTTRASTGAPGAEPQTSVDTEAESPDDLIGQVKSQVGVSLGKGRQQEINEVIDAGVQLIRDSKVKNMTELQTQLEQLYPNDTDLVTKVINATTGFLTAKGTEAGALLSNILANVTQGLQGVMNETEKTTVKVTRTITEQVLSGGQLKEITRVITEPATTTLLNAAASANNPPPATLTDILKNLTGADKQVKHGSQVTQVSTQATEEHESVKREENYELKERAGQVVTKVVEAAVEKLETEKQQGGETAQQQSHQQQNGFHHLNEDSLQEENIKIEEESTVKTSTTKIVLNGSNGSEQQANEDLSNVQQEFFKVGKQEAEIAIKKIENGGGDETSVIEAEKKTAAVENTTN